MAVEADLIFESFSKKRKDKMKFTWVKYWFRLHNTTLYFFTKKHGDALRLHGHYSIYVVQSVREAQAVKADYPFEITMTNGKKKLLSAESADLRTAWIEILWKSMQLPGPGREQSACTWYNLSCKFSVVQLTVVLFLDDFNEDRESAIYETLKVETMEDKPSDEIAITMVPQSADLDSNFPKLGGFGWAPYRGEAGGDAKEQHGAAGCTTSVAQSAHSDPYLAVNSAAPAEDEFMP